jgi:mRNA-degrading endonuclease RelE of RelBE toxin-antitoxin system
MVAYKIFFKKSVWKDFEAVTKKDLKKILQRIDTRTNNMINSIIFFDNNGPSGIAEDTGSTALSGDGGITIQLHT